MASANKFADTSFLIDVFLAGGQAALDALRDKVPGKICTRWAALIVVFCATASCGGAHAMNDLPGSSQPKFVQDAVAHWWSPTAPDGEAFELPSGIKTCSRLKVRFVEKIIWVAARVGPGYPSEASFLVEDNFGDQQYSSGKIIKASFYVQYNDVHFGRSEINRKLGANAFWFQDRNDASLVFQLFPAHDQPETPVAYVCAFKEGEQVLLSYFLKRSPPRPFFDFRQPSVRVDRDAKV